MIDKERRRNRSQECCCGVIVPQTGTRRIERKGKSSQGGWTFQHLQSDKEDTVNERKMEWVKKEE